MARVHFFLTGFLLLILLLKLALAGFSIEITVISNAVVGALIAAKAALVLDDTTLARKLEHYRRAVAVAVKTLFYGVASLLLGYVERSLEALGKVHTALAGPSNTSSTTRITIDCCRFPVCRSCNLCERRDEQHRNARKYSPHRLRVCGAMHTG